MVTADTEQAEILSIPGSCRFCSYPISYLPFFMMSFSSIGLCVFLPFFAQIRIISRSPQSCGTFFSSNYSSFLFSRAFSRVTSSANSSAEPAGSP